MSLLHRLKGLFPVRAASPSAPVRQDALIKLINPTAQDRWLASAVRSYTPETIASTLQGAFSGDLTAQWQLFDLMEGTWPRLTKDLNELKNSICSIEWSMEAWAEEGMEATSEAIRRKKFVSSVLYSMRPKAESDENELTGTMKDLLDALAKGITVLEIDWETRKTPLGSAIAPRCTTWVPPRYYGYASNSGRLQLNLGEIQRTRESGDRNQGTGVRNQTAAWIDFPENKFLIGIAKHKSGHPIGGALLRPLAFWWCAANFTREWFLNYAQVFGLPIRWATYDPARADLLEDISDMLENMGSAGWGAFPAGTVLELKESSKGAGENPQAWLIEFADKQCDLLILGQTLTSDVGSSGSRALGSVHKSVREDVIESGGNWLATVLNNQLIPAICRLNFGDAEQCPYINPAIDEGEDQKALAERDEILLNAGVDMPRAWFYDRHDIPVPEAGEEVIAGRTAPDPNQNPNLSAIGARSGLGTWNLELGTSPLHARDATDQLIDHVLEDLTGVQARWLGGVKPYFRMLVSAAQNEQLTDDQFLRVVEQAQRQFPELFKNLNHQAVAAALEAAMGSAVVNGAVQGAMKRGVRSVPGRSKQLNGGAA